MKYIIISGIVVLALLCQGDATKLSFKPPATEQQPQVLQYYPSQTYQRQENLDQQQQDLSGVKGGQPAQKQVQALPIYPQIAHQQIAFVVLRPVPQYQQSQYQQPQYQQPQYQQSQYHEQPYRPIFNQPSAFRQQTKGGQAINQEPIQQQEEIQQQEIQQQEIPPQQQQQQSFAEEPQHESFGKGKFLKLKSSLDRLAASAKAKFTLGSSYQVVSEELVTPPPQDQQQQKEEIPEHEPENIRDAGEQQVQQQQIQQQHVEQIPEEPRKQAKGVQQVESFKRESTDKQATF